MPLRALFQVLGRDLVMVPKLIHPLPPNEPRTPRSGGEEEDIEEEPPTPHPLNDTWMQVQNLTCCCISSRVCGTLTLHVLQGSRADGAGTANAASHSCCYMLRAVAGALYASSPSSGRFDRR